MLLRHRMPQPIESPAAVGVEDCEGRAAAHRPPPTCLHGGPAAAVRPPPRSTSSRGAQLGLGHSGASSNGGAPPRARRPRAACALCAAHLFQQDGYRGPRQTRPRSSAIFAATLWSWTIALYPLRRLEVLLVPIDDARAAAGDDVEANAYVKIAA